MRRCSFACQPFLPPAAAFVHFSADPHVPHKIRNSGGGGLTGDGPEVTVIQVDYGPAGGRRPGSSSRAHLAAFSFEAQFTIFRDFSLVAVSANGTALTNKAGGAEVSPATGIGFRTSSAVSLDMSSLQISGFTWGIWIRYTVMAAFKSISIRNCAGGVSLARSEAAFGADDATSTSGWNAWAGGRDGGFFHNVVTFTNVHVMGGEIGASVPDCNSGHQLVRVGWSWCPLTGVSDHVSQTATRGASLCVLAEAGVP